MQNSTLVFGTRSAAALVALFTCACNLAPAGLDQERERLVRQGAAFEPAFEERVLALLPSPLTREAAVARALAASGAVEAAYFAWKASLAEVGAAAGWPNTPFQPSVSYLFSDERRSLWNSLTIGLGFDAMETLMLPGKARAAGRAALARARAEAARYEAERFATKRRVLASLHGLALVEARQSTQQELLSLARLLRDSAAARIAGGFGGSGAQRLLEAELELALGERRLADFDGEHTRRSAELAGLLALPTTIDLVLADGATAPRALPSDAELLELGLARDPELAALARELEARGEELALAQLARQPDLDPFAAITGDLEQSLGLAISLPTNTVEIRAGIEAARARRRGAEASLRQLRSDRSAALVGTLALLRASERQAELLESSLLPRAREAAESARRAAGLGGGMEALLDAERTKIELARAITEAQLAREERAADLEELIGVDLESLSGTATSPDTLAAVEPATEER